MDFEQLLVKTAKALNRLEIPYCITGGYAVSIWGRVRATLDIDVVIELLHPKIFQLAAALRALDKGVYADEEMMRSALLYRSEFNVIHGESGIKIDFFIPKDEVQTRRELARRVMRKIRGVNVYFISPEDLILSKLRWHKIGGGEKHTEDIQSVIKRMEKNLDYTYIKRQVKEQALEQEWKEVKKPRT